MARPQCRYDGICTRPNCPFVHLIGQNTNRDVLEQLANLVINRIQGPPVQGHNGGYQGMFGNAAPMGNSAFLDHNAEYGTPIGNGVFLGHNAGYGAPMGPHDPVYGGRGGRGGHGGGYQGRGAPMGPHDPMYGGRGGGYQGRGGRGGRSGGHGASDYEGVTLSGLADTANRLDTMIAHATTGTN